MEKAYIINRYWRLKAVVIANSISEAIEKYQKFFSLDKPYSDDLSVEWISNDIIS